MAMGKVLVRIMRQIIAQLFLIDTGSYIISELYSYSTTVSISKIINNEASLASVKWMTIYMCTLTVQQHMASCLQIHTIGGPKFVLYIPTTHHNTFVNALITMARRSGCKQWKEGFNKDNSLQSVWSFRAYYIHRLIGLSNTMCATLCVYTAIALHAKQIDIALHALHAKQIQIDYT